jgi:hypothetical protein
VATTPRRSLRDRASAAARGAGTSARTTNDALVRAVGRVAEQAINHALLSDERVMSAAEGKRTLAGSEETEAFAGSIQRVVVLAMPVVRRISRGARLTRAPYVMLASSTVSVGLAVRTGARELQVLGSLIAHKLEQVTGAPSDPALVKKVAIDLYLDPKRAPELNDDKLRLVRLTRKWVLTGAFGRSTSKRAAKALEAAERIDAAALTKRWETVRPPLADEDRSRV